MWTQPMTMDNEDLTVLDSVRSISPTKANNLCSVPIFFPFFLRLLLFPQPLSFFSGLKGN
ncbi:uncharacterized protein BO88DRAFT_409432 [Aspergillus vadensis CBS 113365]|uniref:Uncharacterized protein n=1 Tax=Aspergillus vadensis (strain CBS 113365 / IMI 142717 / IBT 24658) TaxID=1448311 RepID=A0A319BIM0_ASPVC|nr:hypothetical protein BO88DRAFT_409432 [Aspergillus vadensis CBS 113365]PYH63188.1 hypothetical protein BO88DRAFT_409432 [Aspergillus vadensis CBS 113365]